MGLARSWTKALDANIIPTATVSSRSSLCRCSFSLSSGEVALVTLPYKV